MGTYAFFMLTFAVERQYGCGENAVLGMLKSDRVASMVGKVTQRNRPLAAYRRETLGGNAVGAIARTPMARRASVDIDLTIRASANAAFEGVQPLNDDLIDGADRIGGIGDGLTPATFHLSMARRARQFHARRQ